MTTPQHTPGPWELRPTSESGSTLLVIGGHTERGNETFVADCGISRSYRTLVEAQANARLIAAAPELLAALEAIVEAGRMSDERRAQYCAEIARAAIAKATGQPA